MVVYKALTLDDDAMALLEAHMQPLSQKGEGEDVRRRFVTTC